MLYIHCTFSIINKLLLCFRSVIFLWTTYKLILSVLFVKLFLQYRRAVNKTSWSTNVFSKMQCRSNHANASIFSFYQVLTQSVNSKFVYVNNDCHVQLIKSVEIIYEKFDANYAACFKIMCVTYKFKIALRESLL